MNNDETFFITPENLVVVLAKFCQAFKSNPLLVISLDEILNLWNSEYVLNEHSEYQITENDLKAFMNKINGIQADRVMYDISKRGLATLAYDSTGFCLIKNKD